MIFTGLLLLVPLSVALAILHAPPVVVFLAAAAAIVPLAEWIRRGTEQMAAHAGSAVGGLMNVTLGNAAELILALFVLYGGRPDIVKATITGSIIGNSLFGLGIAILLGSHRRGKQTFGRERAGLLSSLLVLCVIGLLTPALFEYTEQHGGAGAAAVNSVVEERLSLGVSVVLIVLYAGNLVYTLVTHRDVFARDEARAPASWSLARSLGVLLGATAAVSVEAHLVSGALESAAAGLGLSAFFLGVIVLPMVGNCAEYFAAASFARKDRMDMVMNLSVGSSIQVALFTAPLLVLLSYGLGHPMNLVFANPLELIAVAGSAFAVSSIARDGETTWFEGLLLLGVYAVLALAFYFVTA